MQIALPCASVPAHQSHLSANVTSPHARVNCSAYLAEACLESAVEAWTLPQQVVPRSKVDVFLLRRVNSGPKTSNLGPGDEHVKIKKFSKIHSELGWSDFRADHGNLVGSTLMRSARSHQNVP